jgi:DNA helicase-2/ATP-dependent DNA helicase PcrA
MNLLDDLNPEQIEAVTHVEGPLLVLAGAGSGKTRVITRRVAHLIDQGVSPRNILSITFTNKAAGEMQERVAELVPGGRVWISTFHKFCARLLRIHGQLVGLRDGYVIYDTTDRLKVVRDSLARVSLDRAHWPPERIEAAISRAKNDLLDPVAYSEKASDYFQLNVAKVYRVYQEQLLQANAVDFDDLLLHVATLLRDNPELRAELDERYRFVLVDEYQDTNMAQYAILRCLSVDHPNLCATGDPDQSIYAWRGANIRNILQFESDFPGTSVVRLEKNYRSTKRILAAASHLIRFNRRRKPKDLVTDNPEGLPVQVDLYAHEREEAQSIAVRIREAVDSGRRQFGDFAVFCRVAALTRNLEMAFNIAQVPYQVLSGVAFYERAEVKDLLAYLKLLVNPRDDVAFARVVNVPARGIGKSTLERLQVEAERQGQPLLETARSVVAIASIKPRQAEAILGFVRLIDELTALKGQCVAEVMRQVLDRSAYFEETETPPLTPTLSPRGGGRGQGEGAACSTPDPDAARAESRARATDERRANVEELITAAHQFDLVNPGGTLDEFLTESVLTTDLDDWDEQRQAVSLMTLHAAKGLEFPAVFVVAVEQGILPHKRSKEDDNDFEEERRLLFVGMTRAKEELYLSHVTSREFRGRTERAIPSPFLMELPARPAAAAPERRAPATRGIIITAAEFAGGINTPATSMNDFQQGMLVRHPEFGLGRIAELSGYGPKRKAIVKFTTGGTRTLMLSQAKLHPVKVK